MSTHDTSGHKKIAGASVTNNMSQGNDTALNPGHGAGENTRISIQPGETRGKYSPNTNDMDSRDNHGEDIC